MAVDSAAQRLPPAAASTDKACQRGTNLKTALGQDPQVLAPG